MFERATARLTLLRGWRADAAAAVLGALGAAAFPPVHALPALLLAIPGLLALLGATQGPGGAARRGFWFGFGLNLVGVYWITEPILLEADSFWWLVPFAAPLTALALAAFVAAPAALCRLAPPGAARALVLAGAWTLGDLARQFALTGFPWNPLGSAWAIPGRLGDLFIQPAAWVGVPGLTLATLLLAMLPAIWSGWRGWLAGAAALGLWAGLGAVRLGVAPGPAPGWSVVLAQGNVAEGEKWSRARAGGIFERYLALTAEGVARAGPGPVIVVWPETASPFQLQTDPAARAAIAAAAGPAAVSLVGSVRFDAARRPRNSLMAITGDGPPAAIYDKSHLVPFGEYQPDWFPLGIQIVPGGGFAAGPGPATLHVGTMPPAGALICYEAIFPGAIVARADRPAWLVNVTNDAWFGDSSGPRQHLAAARLRAVEEGLPLLRAANTGISAAFDAHGHELARLGMQRAGVLVVALPPALAPPLFARTGLVMPGVLAAACTLAGFWLGRRHQRGKRFFGSGSPF